MHLSEIGKIAQKYWQEIPLHFPFIELDEFAVMPNHIHGIIIINKSDNEQTPNLGVSDNKWKPGILGVIINQYKRICTIRSRKINPDFSWQSRFHDHIIRNNKSHQNIANYINNNPLNWKVDGKK